MNRCLSEKIAGTLREELSDGRYRAGQRLPGIDALRERFGVGEFAVRHALQMLRDEGFLTLKRGVFANAQNAETGESIPVSDGSVRFTVKKHDLNLVECKIGKEDVP